MRFFFHRNTASNLDCEVRVDGKFWTVLLEVGTFGVCVLSDACFVEED